MKQRLNVLFLSSEVAPFAKTGGLADVATSLPGALKRLGVDVRVVLPYYRAVRDGNFHVTQAMTDLKVSFDGRTISTEALSTETENGVGVYFIVQDDFYDRPGLYGNDSGDYADNFERFCFYCQGALQLAQRLSFHPDIIHCNDWQTGLVPVLLKGPWSQTSLFERASTVFTIHNLGYQGLFPPEMLPLAELSPEAFFHPQGLEFWGNVSLLKAGIVYSDLITTVSPSYARDIQTAQYGMGMEGVLHDRRQVLWGILNGVDYRVWNPDSDGYIAGSRSSGTSMEKSDRKKALLKEMDLDPSLATRPLLGMVSRLDTQKGFDLLMAAAEDILASNVSLVILGSGDKQIEDQLRTMAAHHVGRVGVRIGFNEALSHRIMAGADILLGPSRYEPCGLTHMYALRYGTVPVVRATGGFEDTIQPFDSRTGQGNGFKFVPYDPGAFLDVVRQAIRIFGEPPSWQRLVENAMEADFSWEKSAGQYLDLYSSAVKRQNKEGDARNVGNFADR